MLYGTSLFLVVCCVLRATQASGQGYAEGEDPHLEKIQTFLDSIRALSEPDDIVLDEINGLDQKLADMKTATDSAASSIQWAAKGLKPGMEGPAREAVSVLQTFASEQVDEMNERRDDAVKEIDKIVRMEAVKEKVFKPISQLRFTTVTYFERGQETKPNPAYLLKFCKAYNPAELLSSFYSLTIGECHNAQDVGKYNVTRFSTADWIADQPVDLPRSQACVPDFFMQKRKYSSDAAKAITTLTTNVVGELSYLLAVCTGVAWNNSADAKSHRAKFDKTSKSIGGYFEKGLSELMDAYWPKQVVDALNKVNPTSLLMLDINVKPALVKLDELHPETVHRWNHDVVWWSPTDADIKVSGMEPTKQLCACCGPRMGGYQTFHRSKTPLKFGNYHYLPLRVPSDDPETGNVVCSDEAQVKFAMWYKSLKVEKTFKDIVRKSSGNKQKTIERIDKAILSLWRRGDNQTGVSKWMTFGYDKRNSSTPPVADCLSGNCQVLLAANQDRAAEYRIVFIP